MMTCDPLHDAVASEPTDDPIAALLTHRERFVVFARNRVGSSSLAEDAVQSAFAKALDRRATLRTAAHATAWFYRILRNEIADEARRVRARRKTIERLALADGAAADPDAPRRAHLDHPSERPNPCRCVLTVLASLRDDQAALIQAVDLDGVPVADAAALFSITANHASVRLHRARAALRQRLAAHCGPCALDSCGDCSCPAST